MLIYRFRNCLLNTVERSVIKGDQYVELTTKTFDVLLYLIENAGNIVTKDELLGAVWNGNFVEESNLPVHISKLRRSLGESRGERYIETVQSVGYRFVSPVEQAGSDLWRSGLRAANLLKTTQLSGNRFLDSIAVLPFENESGSTELCYLADGLTETFINRFSLVPDLKVIARNTVFRYKDKKVDVKEVGRMLGVATVLFGRIRVAKDELLLSVELVDVIDGRQLWGELFQEPIDRIVTVRETIVSSVTERLRSHDRENKDIVGYSGSRDPKSYKAYLKGDYLLAKRTAESVNRALDCFMEALSYDRENIHARVKSVDCYRFLYVLDCLPYQAVLEKVEPLLVSLSRYTEATDAIQLTLGTVYAQVYGDFEEAEKCFVKVISVNPNSIEANTRYAEVLAMTERPAEAVEQVNKVLELDPFSVPTYKRVARLLYFLGNHEAALDYLGDALDLEPSDFEARALLGSVLTELGDYPAALFQFGKSLAAHFTVDVLAMVGYVEALRGRRNVAKKIIRQIDEEPKRGNKYPLKLARVYLGLGEKETMYAMLEEALKRPEVELFGLMLDPRWKVVKKEPRFVDLARRVELLAKGTARP